MLDTGEVETGLSIHLVDAEYDTGPVFAQRRMPALAGDTPTKLAARVQAKEQEFLIEVLRQLLSKRVG